MRHPIESDHPRVLAVLSELIAFLIGFLSQSQPGVAYIRFIGIHPSYRRSGIARSLYERFFEVVRARSAHEVHCITSPVNTGSIEFHKRLGFEASAPILNYDGLGGERIEFTKRF